MPQMSPMWWEYLLISFSLLTLIMMVIIYHNPWTQMKNIYNMNNIPPKQMNWKW
uniref:ATP synthase F0 subunit 8 n=1 Tax=Coptosoma parvipictum TaxID=355286 RepID=W8VLH0_9HEMI|nr:ATP synthase F0 subunit 8 [Coptosoma parvipictum]